ncbi:MAG TPA: hypothetical protein PKD64_05120 [Pirellulaceae bacterium]|nr:hypothetical protein [Pirellulaceae bacterium]HMO91557.1 hypothetical protein [Pirellulaceae bacterium]HMP68254.1 hypothetical protein [Pirellulaceae bacterium]
MAKPISAETQGASTIDGLLPTNPLAAISCYTGIFGLILCGSGILLGPTAVLLGFLGLRTWKVQESTYGKTMSSVRAWIGIVTGVLGFIVSTIFIVVIVLNINS